MRLRKHYRRLIIAGTAGLTVGALWVVAERAMTFAEELLLVLAPQPTVSPEPERAEQARSHTASESAASSIAAATTTTTEQSAEAPANSASARALPPEEDSSAASASAQLCPGDLRLLGSVVNSARPARSIAAVRVRGGTQLVNIGERVDAFTLFALRPTKAYLRAQDGTLCLLPVLPSGEQTPVAVSNVAPAKVAPPAKKPLFEPAELSAGIRSLGPNRFGVSSSLLEKALGNVGALRRSARFRVKSENDRVIGLELTSIRKNSPISHLGLQKGDVVRSLNGHNLSEPDGALQALAHLKSQPEASLAILRGGRPQTLTFVKE